MSHNPKRHSSHIDAVRLSERLKSHYQSYQKSFGEELVESAQEALDIAKGESEPEQVYIVAGTLGVVAALGLPSRREED